MHGLHPDEARALHILSTPAITSEGRADDRTGFPADRKDHPVSRAISASISTASATGCSPAAGAARSGARCSSAAMPWSVLPYDPERDAVVLIEQFRIGAAAGRHAAVAAGGRSPASSTRARRRRRSPTARRRRRPAARSSISCPICHYLASPGGTSETVRLYLRRASTAAASAAFTASPRSMRISASRSCPLPRRGRAWRMAGSAMPPRSSRCNGWLLNRDCLRQRPGRAA